MEKLIILAAPNNYIDNLVKDFKSLGISCELVYSLFELKKRSDQEKPASILVADNLKEKKIETLVPGILENESTAQIPVIGLTTTENSLESTIEFFQNGAVDVLHLPEEGEEAAIRVRLRIREAVLKNALTPNEYFFSEAQEKEQGRRNGYFHFYDHRRQKVGDIAILQGKVVSATYASMIKEDAFLQLACNPLLSFRFEDKEDVQTGKIEASITSLLLEASKLKDEIKKQDSALTDSVKCLIIDNSRIARLLAGRQLKQYQIETKALSASEFSIRLLTQFVPRFLLLDHAVSEGILNMIWQTGHGKDDIPVIIYCDRDVKNINFSRIGKHQIESVVYKDELQKKIQTILESLF